MARRRQPGVKTNSKNFISNVFFTIITHFESPKLLQETFLGDTYYTATVSNSKHCYMRYYFSEGCGSIFTTMFKNFGLQNSKINKHLP